MPQCNRKDCKFHTDGSWQYGCNYADVTGRTKVGQSALLGEKYNIKDCKFYECGNRLIRDVNTGKVVELHESRIKIKIDIDRARQLYDEGKNDKEIADELKCDRQAIGAWRRRSGLEANAKGGRKMITDWNLGRQLYDEGYSDVAIARLLNTTRNAVYKWRRRNNLPLERPRWANEKK